MEELDILIEKWDYILQTFKKEYDIQDISFKTWIKPLKIYSLEGNVITLISSEGEMDTVYIQNAFHRLLTSFKYAYSGHFHQKSLSIH